MNNNTNTLHTITWEDIRNYIPGLKARLSHIGKFNQDSEYPNPRENEWGVINHIQYDSGNLYGEITLKDGYSFDFDTLEEIEVELPNTEKCNGNCIIEETGCDCIKTNNNIPSYDKFMQSKGIYDMGVNGIYARYKKDAHEYAVLFAKYHRLQQIEAIKENAMMTHHCGRTKENKPINYYQIGPDNIKPCKDSIENAYTEDNIK